MTLKRFVDKTGDFRSTSDFVSIMTKGNYVSQVVLS